MKTWKTNTKTWPHSQFLAEDLQSFWNARTSQSSTNMVNNLLKWLDTGTPEYKTLPRQIPITINYLTASSPSSKIPNTLRNNQQIKKIHSIVISFIFSFVNNWIDNKDIFRLQDYFNFRLKIITNHSWWRILTKTTFLFLPHCKMP